MSTETRKLHIIEAVLKTEDDAILQAMETIVATEALSRGGKGLHGNLSDIEGLTLVK